MSLIMRGKQVAEDLKKTLKSKVEHLSAQGIVPRLAIVRMGKRQDDLAYERSAVRTISSIGIDCKIFAFPEDMDQDSFTKEFTAINEDTSTNGVLLFRPLPKHIDEKKINSIINPNKDIDCMNAVNIAKVFAGDETMFASCTAEAVIKMLDYYDVDIKGKNVTIVGRSMVVGRPLSMLLLHRHATVTICHTKTVDLVEQCRKADILIAAAGKEKMIKKEYINENSVVIDVGINVDSLGNLCGDVDFDDVCDLAHSISPVPGGVGSVTSCVLADHVIRAAGIHALI